MSENIQRLAALVGSRICHDLISPIGAIQNGVELLAMEGRAGPEMDLIDDSVKNASARVRFMRVAFGLAGQDQPISQAEVAGTLADMGRGGRTKYDWTLSEDCLRRDAQMVFLAMMCLDSAMPRGGVIVAGRDGSGWAVTGPAQADRPDTEMWEVLSGRSSAEPLPAHVQFMMLPIIAAEAGQTITTLPKDGAVTIRIG